jgi:preprotein translocase subunit SecG
MGNASGRNRKSIKRAANCGSFIYSVVFTCTSFVFVDTFTLLSPSLRLKSTPSLPIFTVVPSGSSVVVVVVVVVVLLLVVGSGLAGGAGSSTGGGVGAGSATGLSFLQEASISRAIAAEKNIFFITTWFIVNYYLKVCIINNIFIKISLNFRCNPYL